MSAVLKEPEVQLSTLVAQWLEAKRVEINAIEARRTIDAEIVKLMPKKDEGSVSKKVGLFKVGVTFGVSRKADTEALRLAWEQLSEVVKGAFRWKAEVSTTEFKALSEKDADAAAYFVESKPASPSVKIEVIGEK